ncbi:putative G- coupled receptor 34 [Labeo rohita]|uniref:Putative G-coupled receptor 34 n=1 Tax=Labeo rohita TaxID=84645 RepID=A0A498NC10_LABRO|nr:putative G- coupled receptor 34 [Labeo rohita]
MNLVTCSNRGNPATQEGNLTINESCQIHDGILSPFLPIGYIVICCIGLLCNTITLYIFFLRRHADTSMAVYMRHLALADTLLVMCLPLRVYYHNKEGPFYLCKVVGIFFYLNMYSSILFLSLISLDRYLKIIKPVWVFRIQKTKWSHMASYIVWAILISGMIPFFSSNSQKHPCDKVCFHFHSKGTVGGTINLTTVVLFLVFYVAFLCFYVRITKKLKTMSMGNGDPKAQSRKKRVIIKTFLVPAIFTLNLEGNLTINDSCQIHDGILSPFLPIGYIVICCIGLLCNTITLYIFFFREHADTSMVVYMRHLTLADTLLVMCLPLRVYYHNKEGPFYLCKVVGIFFYLNMYSSILFLSLISLDRYLKIIKPVWVFRIQKTKWSHMASYIIWVILILGVIPFFTSNNHEHPCDKICFHFHSKGLVGGTINLTILLLFLVFYVAFLCFYLRITKRFRTMSMEKKNNMNFVDHSKLINASVWFGFGKLPPGHSKYSSGRVKKALARVTENNHKMYQSQMDSLDLMCFGM